MSSYRNLALKEDLPSDNSLLKRLKGLDSATWNKVVGSPVKPGRGQLQFPFPYQWTIYNEEEGLRTRRARDVVLSSTSHYQFLFVNDMYLGQIIPLKIKYVLVEY
ncbi:MAG: hypothetical protein WAZ77_10725 [Candidatus Nitrosopolaris sp.]